MHVPLWQVSPVVQAFASLHDAPFVLGGFEQTPVAELHEPASWHWSSAEHTTGLPLMHVPLWQVSAVVQAFASLHDAPFVLGGFEQTPVAVLHEPASWHWSSAEHTTGAPLMQAPPLH